MLNSVFVNNGNGDVTVFILHTDLTSEDMGLLSSLPNNYGGIIRYIYIDRQSLGGKLPTNTEWPIEVYFRLMIPDIMPADIDRVLYLDSDIIVNNSLNELYNTDFDGKLFVATQDVTCKNGFGDFRDELFREIIESGHRYFNSGVMLWNVEGIRQAGYSFEVYTKLAKELNYQIVAYDQDLLNYVHCDQIKYVDGQKYNLFTLRAYQQGMRYEQLKESVCIAHYAGTKPWQGMVLHYELEKLWWDYAIKAPFYHELMESFIKESIMNPSLYNTVIHYYQENTELRSMLGKSKEIIEKLTGK